MNFFREAFGEGFSAGERFVDGLNLQQFMGGIPAPAAGQQQRRRRPAAAAEQQGAAAAAAPPPPFSFFAGAAAPHNNMAREPVAPPASAAAIRQLPTICVAPEDLIDTTNRECSICLEEHHLGEKVLRLPCAHIFHKDCIVDWLQKFHCTCPTCRYELETDDAMFELGRRERMLQRKLRFAQWELERMSVRELHVIWNSLQQQQPQSQATTSHSRTSQSQSQQRTFVEKSDLLQAILSSPRVDIIHTPAPVSYHMHELQGMSISRLKHAMQEAGVFFDPKDVVEKQDMYQIFKNSGRLILLTNEEEEVEIVPPPPAAQYHETHRDTALRQNAGLSKRQRRSLLVETVESDDEDSQGLPTNGNGSNRRSSRSSVFMEPIHYNSPPSRRQPPPQQQQQQQPPPEDHSTPTQPTEDFSGAEVVDEQQPEPAVPEACVDEDEGEIMDYEIISEDSPRAPAEQHHGQFDDADEDFDADDDDDQVTSSSNHSAPTNPHHHDPSPPTASRRREEATSGSFSLEDRSIAELQLLANFMNINVDRCLEKADMIDCLRTAPPLRDAVAFWSVSVLTAMARLVNIDVSSLLFTSSGPTTTQERLVGAMLQQAHQQPHVAPYVNSLVPLARLNASELKAVARQRGVAVSGCLEVGDLFYQLVSSATTTSSSAATGTTGAGRS